MSSYSVQQFHDKELSQYGYLLKSGSEAVVIDPARDVSAILKLLSAEGLTLRAIIETHPHADFVSGHAELHEKTGAPIYVSKLLGAMYEYKPYDNGDSIELGDITLHALNTPGHSPDSISILVKELGGKDVVLFSGDTLFVGDVGRPDLREKAGNMQAKREELAGMMYDTVQNVLKKLPDDVVVYPAHGAGSLCGKALKDAPSTTIGLEKQQNPAFQEHSRDAFIAMLTDGQPMIPKYFGFEVGVNRTGAKGMQESLQEIPTLSDVPADILALDVRDYDACKKGYHLGALHIPEYGERFETWLGTVVSPDEHFVVVVENEDQKKRALYRIAKIGYEKNVEGVVVGSPGNVQPLEIDIDEFKADPSKYTVIDVRQPQEFLAKKIFSHAVNIPLNELRERVSEIPQGKPIAVHCAGGYRSLIAASILRSACKESVYDIGEKIRSFVTKV